MLEDLATHFYTAVVRAFERYESERDSGTTSRRHLQTAVEAATALFHFREHIPDKFRVTRKDVESQCPEYGLIGDVANSAKHSKVTQKTPHGTPLVSTTTDLEEIAIVTEYEDSGGKYYDSQTFIEVQCSDGTKRNLDAALSVVMAYWIERLEIWGGPRFLARPIHEIRRDRFVIRSEAKSHTMEMTKGLRFPHSFSPWKFDPTIGKAVPTIFPPDSEFEMRVYKAKPKMFIRLIPPDGKSPVQIDIAISDDEDREYQACTTDIQRKLMKRHLTEVHAEEIRVAIQKAFKAEDGNVIKLDTSKSEQSV